MQVGIVGCGGIAAQHLGAYEQVDDVRVAWVYDKNPSAAEVFAKRAGARVAPSLEALAEAVDAASVCTPPAAHLASCQPLIERGVPVLCEKPLERDATQAAALVELVHRHQAVFMVGFCHRHHGPIIELKRLIEQGILGEPVVMQCTFTGWASIAGTHHVDPRLAGGGCLIDNGSHFIDLFRYLIGEPTGVSAAIANCGRDFPVEDLALIQLDIDGRRFGTCCTSFSLPPGTAGITVHGSRGSATVGYGPPIQGEINCRLADQTSPQIDCSIHPSRFVGQARSFIAAARGERPVTPNAFDGLRVNVICQAAYDAAREHARRAVLPNAGADSP